MPLARSFVDITDVVDEDRGRALETGELEADQRLDLVGALPVEVPAALPDPVSVIIVSSGALAEAIPPGSMGPGVPHRPS